MAGRSRKKTQRGKPLCPALGGGGGHCPERRLQEAGPGLGSNRRSHGSPEAELQAACGGAIRAALGQQGLGGQAQEKADRLQVSGRGRRKRRPRLAQGGTDVGLGAPGVSCARHPHSTNDQRTHVMGWPVGRTLTKPSQTRARPVCRDPGKLLGRHRRPKHGKITPVGDRNP